MAIIIGDKWREKLLRSHRFIQNLQKEYHSDQALISAETQIVYLLALADGIEEDDSRLEEIMLGYLAMYQLTDILSHDEAELLCEIADKIRRYLLRNNRVRNVDRS